MTTSSCAQCGSENDEGSRFCGVCGEKLARAGEVIASPDDDGVAPAGGTRTAVLPNQRTATPRPTGVFDPSDQSLRMPASGGAARSIAIALLLLTDAGLATAGALFMKAGLAKKEAVVETGVTIDAGSFDSGPSDPRSGRADDASPDSGTGTVIGPGPGTSHGTGTGTGTGTVDDVVSDIFGKHPDARPAPPPTSPDATIPVVVVVHPPDAAPAAPPPDAAGTGPVDPYATPDAAPDVPGSGTGTGTGSDVDDPRTVDLASEVERKSSQSQSRFTHCYQESAKAYTPDQPLAGEVDIAFRVMPTGEVQNAAAVRNTTGSDKLADCLTAVIAAWTFPPSQLAEPAVFIRPLRFDGH